MGPAWYLLLRDIYWTRCTDRVSCCSFCFISQSCEKDKWCTVLSFAKPLSYQPLTCSGARFPPLPSGGLGWPAYIKRNRTFPLSACWVQKGDLLAGYIWFVYTVVHAGLCWFRGIGIRPVWYQHGGHHKVDWAATVRRVFAGLVAHCVLIPMWAYSPYFKTCFMSFKI